MPKPIVTHRDAIIYTAGRIALAGGLTALVTFLFLLSDLGTDANALVSVGQVTHSSMAIAIGVSTILSGALSYRSACLMRQLTLARAELARMSRTDPLTGLLNRRGFDDAAAPMLAQAVAEGRRVVALMCDIDRFKAINDRYGHDTGDLVLARIGAILRDYADANDLLIARHGGEEFAGLMIGVSDDDAIRCAQALCRLCSTHVAGDDVAAPVTMSFGLAAHTPGGDLASLMRRADQALYRAKDLGRNCVVQIDEMEAVALC